MIVPIVTFLTSKWLNKQLSVRIIINMNIKTPTNKSSSQVFTKVDENFTKIRSCKIKHPLAIVSTLSEK